MRKRKNKISIYMLLGIIYSVMLLTVSTAYSFLNESLSIKTSASIPQRGKDYIIDNTLVSKTVENGTYIYEYNIVLTYLGEKPTKRWEAYIKTPFDTEIMECHNAESCTVEGETLTIKSNTQNSVLKPLNNSTTFTYKFKTSNPDYVFNAMDVKFFYDNIEPPGPGPDPDIPVVDYADVSYRLDQDWGKTKQYILTIDNQSTTISFTNWEAKFQLPQGTTIGSIWDAKHELDPDTNILTVTGPNWSPGVPPATKILVNMVINPPPNEEPTALSFIATTSEGKKVSAILNKTKHKI